MPILVNPTSKFAVLFLIAAGTFLATITLATVLKLETPTAQTLFVFVLYPLVYLATRFFRAADESSAPRPWWKVTNSKYLALVLALLMFSPLVSALAHSGFLTAVPILAFAALCCLTFIKLEKPKAPMPRA